MFTDAEIARERFLHDHHHLMCPWAYGDGEKKRRDGILFRRQWQRQTR